MGLARSTFYDVAPLPLEPAELVARIGAICDEFECYGYRRVGAALRHQGVVVNSKKLRRLMREHDLQPKRRRRYVVTTDSDHAGPIFPDLCRFLDAGGIDPFRTLGRPASRKRQGTKSRSAGQRLGGERYGDFRLAAYSMEARRRSDGTRMPVRGGGREGGRSVPRGVERYKRAPAAWIALNRAERDRRRRRARTGMRRGAEEVRLTTYRTRLASAATSARSRARRPR